MANPIRRLVQLVLDKAAARKTEEDAKKTLGGVDDAMGKLREGAKKLAAAFAAAFAVTKIIEFGKAAVQAAAEAERQYAQLANTVNATGAAYADLETAVLAAADAFEAATIHDDGAYAEGLNRMVSLTGDVEASMANMGLAANVAAQFFDGELGPAVDMVSKAMNGNVIALQKMGIQATGAQDALNILAERSMGAAEARAATFSGRVDQLNNAWGNFQKEVGLAMLASDGASTSLNFLSVGVQYLRDWVAENEDAIKGWVTSGVRFAIAAVDVLYRAVTGMANLFQGAFNLSLGVAAKSLTLLVRGYSYAVQGAAALARATGADGLANDLLVHAAAVNANADALNAWADAAIRGGSEQVGKGLDRLASPVFNADMFRTAPGGRARLDVNAPEISSAGAAKDAAKEGEEDAPERLENRLDRINKALTDFGVAQEQTRVLSDILGSDFDALGAEAKSLESAIVALAAEGLEPTDPLFAMMTERLAAVRAEMKMLEKVTNEETAAMETQAAVAGVLATALGAAMMGGLGPFAKQKARQNMLEAGELGIRATIAALTGFGAAKAGAFAAAAGRHLSLAAAWGALGASVGGGGSGGGGVVSAGSGGTGGGTITPTTARTTSSASASRANPVAADVAIYLTGPGFDALNPEVQRVVRGAVQESADRYGNARVRVVRRNSPA